MKIIGRKAEQEILARCLQSNRPEFLIVYGRRRVGKTYLIREFFRNRFSFYTTGVPNQKTKDQLAYFAESLQNYGDPSDKAPENWLQAFSRLRKLLEADNVKRDPVSGKRIIFLDELPWMDTPRSNFRSALDYFWNVWASAQPDLVLIVCGSATSWIIEHMLDDRGGFYQRITRQIHLMPFSLLECEELLKENGTAMTRRQILQSYMVLGGIPAYLNLLDPRLSMDQNIHTLFFEERGELRYEFDHLYHSLFRNPQKHMAIVRQLAQRRGGFTRVELSDQKEIGNGEPLTKALEELEQCGFIRKYNAFPQKGNGSFFQLIDPFTIFSLHFQHTHQKSDWLSLVHTPEYYAWRGLAFETLCLNHLSQIKDRLGISGIQCDAYSWRSEKSSPGAQIDLLIDRRDDVINLCEMKYTTNPFSLDAEEEQKLLHRLEVFRKETNTSKALHLTLISAEGLIQGAHVGIVTWLITGDDLFR